jgi:hypothetical protein
MVGPFEQPVIWRVDYDRFRVDHFAGRRLQGIAIHREVLKHQVRARQVPPNETIGTDNDCRVATEQFNSGFCSGLLCHQVPVGIVALHSANHIVAIDESVSMINVTSMRSNNDSNSDNSKQPEHPGIHLPLSRREEQAIEVCHPYVSMPGQVDQAPPMDLIPRNAGPLNDYVKVIVSY